MEKTNTIDVNSINKSFNMFSIIIHGFDIQGVSGNLASQICKWSFDFKPEPILATTPAASENEANVNSGQN